jgi:hypothetical protein
MNMRFALVLLFIQIAFSQNEPDAKEIIRRSVDHDLLNFERLKDYTYTERAEARAYDTRGKLKRTEIETHEIVFLGGHDYARLIARDDQPLSERDARKEQDKLDREIDKREHESAGDKARYERERREERKFLDEVPEAFFYRLVGEEMISGNPAWVILADPKPAYRPKDSRAKFLTKVRAKIWIDKKEYQWVKVDADATEKLSVGFHMLQIEPGATVHFEQARINDEVWLPAAAKVYVNARLALFKQMHSEVDIQFRDYKKFQAESHLVAAGQ